MFLSGAKVVATSRGKDKAKEAISLGADVSVDVTSEDFAEVTKKSGGADVILDMVGAPYIAKNLEAINTGGRLVYIATQAGDKLDVSIRQIMQSGS